MSTYKVTFEVTINDEDTDGIVGPATAIEQSRKAVANYGSAGFPPVFARVVYTRTVDEGWSLRSNPDRAEIEKQ